nr:hypothetical protein GCM10010200_056250 [Actinomadura rugatobispora]
MAHLRVPEGQARDSLAEKYLDDERIPRGATSRAVGFEIEGWPPEPVRSQEKKRQ